MYNLNLFKNNHNFNKRLSESNRIMNKYPDRLPIICQRSQKAFQDCPCIDKTKYLLPKDLTMGQFLYVIRKRIKLAPEKAIFIFIHDKLLPPVSELMEFIYSKHKDEDGFLYLTYTGENTFG